MLRCLVGSLVLVDVEPVSAGALALRDEQGHDEAVDAASLAKNYTDQVLGLDAGHLNHRAQD